MDTPDIGGDIRFATLLARKAHEDELDELVRAWTASRPAEATASQLQAIGIPASPVATSKDLGTDPHLEASGAFVRIEHRDVGTRQHVGPPWRTDAYATTVRHAAPCLGADTQTVLADVCGYSADEIATLAATGVLR